MSRPGRHRRRDRPRPSAIDRGAAHREIVETRLFGVLRWVVIAFFLVITLFPFYYMVMLSSATIEELLRDPGASGRRRRASTFDTYGEVLTASTTAARASCGLLRNSGLVAAGRDGRSPCWSRSPARTPSAGCSSSAAGRCTSCSWRSTCSRRSCWRSRCSCCSRSSGCAARWSA